MFKKEYKNNLACRFVTKFLLLVSSFVVVLAVTEARSEGQIFKHRLSNGLEIVVKPDHRSPVAAIMLWYRAGSIDEVNGRTGIAHLLEHMMFQGTGYNRAWRACKENSGNWWSIKCIYIH